jgi:hypothetical protein
METTGEVSSTGVFRFAQDDSLNLQKTLRDDGL